MCKTSPEQQNCARDLVFEATENATSNWTKMAVGLQLGGGLAGVYFSLGTPGSPTVPLLLSALCAAAISDGMQVARFKQLRANVTRLCEKKGA